LENENTLPGVLFCLKRENSFARLKELSMKKILLYLLLCCSCFLSFSQMNEKVILNEEFNDNKKFWNLYTGSYASVEMKNGALVMENKDKVMRISGFGVNIDTSFDFRIVTSPKMISGDQSYGYGFYFGALNIKNSYFFYISGGHYLLLKYENGKDSILINWTKHPSIHAGYNAGNILMLSKEKDTWKFYSNGQFVTSYKAFPFFGKEIGLVVEGPQKVEFDHLLVKNLYPIVKAEGSLCEMLPKIKTQANAKFNTIHTEELISAGGRTADVDRADRRTRSNMPAAPQRYKPTMVITDAWQNYVDVSNNYISVAAVYDTKEDALKKLDSLKNQLSGCLKNYTISKSALYSNQFPHYTIVRKIDKGFVEESNALYIENDSLRNKFSVAVRISSWEGITRNFIESKSDNTKLASQLKQLITHSNDHFKKIRGAMIPGPRKDTTYYRKYATTFKLEGANDNYIDYSTGITSFIASFGDKLKDADAETLFNSLADKLKKALGAEMLYTFEQGKESYNKLNKEISFINKNDDSDNRGVILMKTKTSDTENLFKVEIWAANHWSVAY
jgi:hypothetical protein